MMSCTPLQKQIRIYLILSYQARLAKGDLTPKQRATALREIAEAKKALDDAADLFID